MSPEPNNNENEEQHRRKKRKKKTKATSSQSYSIIQDAIAKNIAQSRSREPLYYPTIYQYKCRGKLSLTDEEAPICRGMQSKLRHVRDLHQCCCTQQEGIDLFVQATTTPTPYNNVTEEEEEPVEAVVEDVLKTQAILFPIENYNKKDDDNESEQGLRPVQTQSTTTTIENKIAPDLQTNYYVSKRQSSDGNNNNNNSWHHWDVYGTSNVNLLVLRDAKTSEETLVGVAPDCRLGLSVRDMGNDKIGGFTVAVGRIGPLEVTSIRQEDDRTYAKKEQQKKKQGASFFPSGNFDQNKNNNNNNNNNDQGSSNTMVTKLQEGFFNHGGKLVKAMKNNAIILKDSFRDDFPNRCWQSSQRIVLQFEKTIHQSSKLLHDLYNTV
eukprot:CAMPEP_0178923720 /NCGR_PEP_ID=MMETSP0786-20121207/16908_1 /TAXON_ID=186022 /ORGANISM="Thalassionema frauenfeldii, Strain CCMP 1798" /LENGTH=379 /DNA_ID=CAMNT_0020598311 /DNA_START=12 /DNA_END=1147 /DNA_ORIENTATION=-